MAEPRIIDGFEGLGGIFAEVEDVYTQTDYTGTLESIAFHLYEEHQRYFDAATDPSGAPWAPLAESTVAKKGDDTILIESEDLIDSLTSEGGSHYQDIIRDGSNNQHVLQWGSDIEYLTFHITGTKTMPKREPVGITTEFLGVIVDSIAERTVKELTSGR